MSSRATSVADIDKGAAAMNIGDRPINTRAAARRAALIVAGNDITVANTIMRVWDQNKAVHVKNNNRGLDLANATVTACTAAIFVMFQDIKKVFDIIERGPVPKGIDERVWKIVHPQLCGPLSTPQLDSAELRAAFNIMFETMCRVPQWASKLAQFTPLLPKLVQCVKTRIYVATLIACICTYAQYTVAALRVRIRINPPTPEPHQELLNCFLNAVMQNDPSLLDPKLVMVAAPPNTDRQMLEYHAAIANGPRVDESLLWQL